MMSHWLSSRRKPQCVARLRHGAVRAPLEFEMSSLTELLLRICACADLVAAGAHKTASLR